jgi:PAS domain-containing protein
MHENRPKTSFPQNVFNMLEKQAAIGAWMINFSTNEMKWSVGMYKIIGMDPDIVHPSASLLSGLVHPEDLENFNRAGTFEVFQTVNESRFRIIRPDGRMVWLNSRWNSFYGTDGKPEHRFGFSMDVTAFEKAQNALSQQISVYRKVADQLDMSILLADAKGNFLHAPDWKGLSTTQMSFSFGQFRIDLVHPDDEADVRCKWEHALAQGSEFKASYRLQQPNGRYTLVHTRGFPERGEDGDLSYWICISSPAPAILGSVETTKETGWATVDVLSADYVRAARALLGWTATQLAREAGVSFSTVRRIENGEATPRSTGHSAVLDALGRAGISFGRHEDGSMSMRLI